MPLRKGGLPPEWSVIRPEGFNAVYWAFGNSPPLSCNGLRVADVDYRLSDAEFAWPEETQLRRSCIAVLDGAANLPLTTQRYQLSQRSVLFIDELARDVMLSVVAHALVCGPTSCAGALSLQSRHPLMESFSFYTEPKVERPFSEGLLRWCTTSAEMVPADAWLYSLLKTESCLVYGSLSLERNSSFDWHLGRGASMERLATADHAILPWYGVMPLRDKAYVESIEIVAGLYMRILTTLAIEGVAALGHNVAASYIFVSAHREFDFSGAVRERPVLAIWNKIHSTNSQRPWFEAKADTLTSRISLTATLETMEAALPRDHKDRYVLYMAEIRTKRVERSPESLIAKIWNECLGARPIPFEPEARKALIADGCKQPELKRHIEAWQEMKRTGSKWVTGG